MARLLVPLARTESTRRIPPDSQRMLKPLPLSGRTPRALHDLNILPPRIPRPGLYYHQLPPLGLATQQRAAQLASAKKSNAAIAPKFPRTKTCLISHPSKTVHWTRTWVLYWHRRLGKFANLMRSPDFLPSSNSATTKQNSSRPSFGCTALR